MRALLPALLFSCFLSAQPRPLATEMIDAVSEVYEKCNLMTAISGTGWRPGLCLAGARVATGETVSLSVNLEGNIDYNFIAAGSGTSADIDLFLRDAGGLILAADTEPDATPIVSFRPDSSGVYTLQLHSVGAAETATFLALGLLRSGGAFLMEPSYRYVSEQFGGAAGAVYDLNGKLRLREAPGSWCLFGYLLEENNGLTLRAIDLPAGRHLIAATGGRNFQNIDLYLADDRRRIVKSDRGSDPYPLLDFTNRKQGSYELRIEVERSRTRGLILLALFDQ